MLVSRLMKPILAFTIFLFLITNSYAASNLKNVSFDRREPSELTTRKYDAATVMAAIKIGISVYSALKKDNIPLEELRSINAKLQNIARLQVAILDELRGLRVFFRNELREAFIGDLNSILSAYMDEFDYKISNVKPDGSLTEDSLNSLKTLRMKTRDVAFRLRHYGPAAYEAAHMAMNFYKVIGQTLGVNSSEDKIFFGKFVESADEWLSPDIEGSFLFQKNAATTRATDYLAVINAYPRARHSGTKNCTCERTSCSVEVWEIITGNVRDGFAAHDEYRNRYCRGGTNYLVESSDNVEFDTDEYMKDVYKRALTSSGKFGAVDKISKTDVLKVFQNNREKNDYLNGLRSSYLERTADAARLGDIIVGVKNMRRAAVEYGNL